MGREIRLQVPGLYNICNAAATAGAVAMGISLEAIQKAGSKCATSFGRMERLNIRNDGLLWRWLKPKVGFNEVIHHTGRQNRHKYLLMPSMTCISMN